MNNFVMWTFTLVFSLMLYQEYKHAQYVKVLDNELVLLWDEIYKLKGEDK